MNTEQERAELLPCPFCGGNAHIERMGTPRQSCQIACGECGAWLETGEEGKGCGKAWNRRDALQSQDRETCSWSYDESDGAYQTSCGNMHIIIDGTPDDNGMKYCCYCGGRITPAIDHARRVEGDGE